MKGLVYFLGLSLLAPVWAGGDGGSGLADEEPTREEYNATLNELRDREAHALLKISRLKQEAADLKEAIRREKENTKKTWGEILQAMGSTQQQYDDYVRSLEELRKKIQSPAMGKSTPGEFTKTWKELRNLKQNKLALIPSLEQVVFDLESRMTALDPSPEKARTAPGPADEKPVPAATPSVQGKKTPAIKQAKPGSPAPAPETEKPGAAEKSAPGKEKSTKAVAVAPDPSDPKKGSGNFSEGKDSKRDLPEVEVPRDLPSRLYRVKPGETLWKIAQAVDPAGEKYNWIFLYALNASQIEDPHHIYAGQIIKIPKGEQ